MLMVYLTMVDEAGDNETKDRTKEIVRWFSEEARIPCALNMRYMEKIQLLRRKEHRGVVYIYRR